MKRSNEGDDLEVPYNSAFPATDGIKSFERSLYGKARKSDDTVWTDDDTAVKPQVATASKRDAKMLKRSMSRDEDSDSSDYGRHSKRLMSSFSNASSTDASISPEDTPFTPSPSLAAGSPSASPILSPSPMAVEPTELPEEMPGEQTELEFGRVLDPTYLYSVLIFRDLATIIRVKLGKNQTTDTNAFFSEFRERYKISPKFKNLLRFPVSYNHATGPTEVTLALNVGRQMMFSPPHMRQLTDDETNNVQFSVASQLVEPKYYFEITGPDVGLRTLLLSMHMVDLMTHDQAFALLAKLKEESKHYAAQPEYDDLGGVRRQARGHRPVKSRKWMAHVKRTLKSLKQARRTNPRKKPATIARAMKLASRTYRRRK